MAEFEYLRLNCQGSSRSGYHVRDNKNDEVTKQAIVWLVIFTGTNFSLNRPNLPWFDATSRGQTVCAPSDTVEVSV